MLLKECSRDVSGTTAVAAEILPIECLEINSNHIKQGQLPPADACSELSTDETQTE